jgi:pimeloyl-ACP methyl ester carboxylesterase
MARFFLVHGAGHGAWCWDHLTPHLDRLGHAATAVDLAGMGADPTPMDEVTWDSTVEKLLAELDSVGEPVVIAAHSMGGTLAAQLAECRPDNVLAVVYVAATLPRNGESCLSNVQEDISAAALLLTPGPDEFSQEADVAVAKVVLWGGCPDDIADVAAAKRRRQSVGVFAGTVTITDEREG